MFKSFFSLAFIALCFIASNVFAAQPEPWQLGFQEAASPVAENLHNFHNLLLIIITAITIFVTLLLVYVCIKFREKNNPKPSKTTHNTLLEIIWTLVPVIILVAIAVPSVKSIYLNERVENAEMTLKVIGKQWYWSYMYPDHDNFGFDSNMLADDQLAEGDVRMLSVDNEVVLPVDTVIRLQVTGADVIHNIAVPALGLKIDAIPGRLNEGWVKIEKEGTYFGQCSELCGARHGFMPIEIRAVSKEEFKLWVEKAKQKFSYNNFNFIEKIV